MSANVNRIAFTGEMPWWIGMPQHDKGQWTRTEGYMTAAEAMAATGMDFRVGKAPILTYPTKQSHAQGLPVRVPGLYSIIRSDTLAPLPGVAVGEDYTPISFPEMFEVLDEVVTKAGARYETAGTLYDGRTGWCMIRLDKSLYIADDEVRTFVMATTAHDGSAALRVKGINTRVVCCNTFHAAESEFGQSFSFRHTKNYRERIEDAQRVLRVIPKEREAFETFAKALLAKPLDKAGWRKLSEVLFPVPDDTPENPLTDRMIQNVNKKRELLARAGSADDLGNTRWTAWGAYNAVADLEQHLLGVKNHCDDQTKVARLFARSFEQAELVKKAASFLQEV